jgi:hypothetical protein
VGLPSGAAPGEKAGMAKRGVTLSIFAILFVLLAISNILKPFSRDSSTAFIFLGARTSGATQATLASLFALYLLVYAAGIWRMHAWVLYLAYAYAAWVILNMVLFGLKNRPAPLVLNIVSMVVGIGVSSGAAILLTRRKAQLS